MSAIVYLNCNWVDLKDARVSILDQGILRGDGLFETIKGVKGKIPFLNPHLDRFYQGAEIVDLKIPVARSDMEKILVELLKKNNLQDARIRVVVTRGVGQTMDPLDQPTQPTFFAMAEPLPTRPTEEDYQKGVSLITVPISIHNGLFPMSVKSTSYFHNMAAKRFAKKQDHWDAIFVDQAGFCSETTTANIFWVEKGKVFTTPLSSGALPGVTRQSLTLVLKRLGHALGEEKVLATDLPKKDEVFLSSSIIGILPVTEIDGQVIGKQAGPLSLQIRQDYQRFVEELVTQ